MNRFVLKRNELLAEKVIRGLKSRNMTGYYAATREEALEIGISLIPEGSSGTMGGCVSAREIGLVTAVQEGNYRFIDRDNADDKRAVLLEGYDVLAIVRHRTSSCGQLCARSSSVRSCRSEKR